MTSAEYLEKRRRLLGLLDAEALDAVVLRRPTNLSWYSGGGRFHIVATPEVAVADLAGTNGSATTKADRPVMSHETSSRILNPMRRSKSIRHSHGTPP
jgi:hypothetical protein